MQPTNRQRLENIRAEIIGTLRATGKDLENFLNQDEAEWDINDIPIESYDDGNGEVAVVMDIPLNPNKDKELARTLRDQYTLAFTICTSKEKLTEDGPKIADRLIAKWGDAQMLLICPEILDDETPDIQSDVRDMLKRVQDRLEVFKQPRKVGNQETMAEFFTAVKGMGLDDVARVQLDAAEDILYEVQKTAKAMMFEELGYRI